MSTKTAGTIDSPRMTAAAIFRQSDVSAVFEADLAGVLECPEEFKATRDNA